MLRKIRPFDSGRDRSAAAGDQGNGSAMTVTEDGPACHRYEAVYGPGIDPERLAVCLSVLDELDKLDVDHPDAIAVRRATAGHLPHRQAAPPPGAPGRQDRARQGGHRGHGDRLRPAHRRRDRGHPAVVGRPRRAEIAGILQRPRSCYTCKTRYVEVDYFYHQLCPDCARLNRAKRDARADLTGKRALLTGGRAKIGMYIALRLLRDGAHTTITTRFPKDAIRRFKAMDDSADWMHRLEVVGIDLRDPAQAVALADQVAEAGPLDILDQQRRRRPYAACPPPTPPWSTARALRCPPVNSPPTTSSAPSTPARSTAWPRCPSASAASTPSRSPTSRWSRATPASPGTSTAPPSTRAAWSPTSSTPTPGCRPSSRSPRWSCSRPSCATTPRRSS